MAQRSAQGLAERWARGAFGVVLAYVLFFQLIGTGLAAQRMALGAGDGLAVICTGLEGRASPSGDAPASQDHADCCALCAFGTQPPLLPQAAGDAVSPSEAVGVAVAWILRADIHPQGRREPRSSQGPPRSA